MWHLYLVKHKAASSKHIYLACLYKTCRRALNQQNEKQTEKKHKNELATLRRSYSNYFSLLLTGVPTVYNLLFGKAGCSHFPSWFRSQKHMLPFVMNSSTIWSYPYSCHKECFCESKTLCYPNKSETSQSLYFLLLLWHSKAEKCSLIKNNSSKKKVCAKIMVLLKVMQANV